MTPYLRFYKLAQTIRPSHILTGCNISVGIVEIGGIDGQWWKVWKERYARQIGKKIRGEMETEKNPGYQEKHGNCEETR